MEFKCLLLFLHFLSAIATTKSNDPNQRSVHHCVHATKKIAKKGDGSTSISCMSCDPTLPTCSIGCQTLIDYMYKVCDRICLPEGYYYDSSLTYSGCWTEIKDDIKIAVERCGCNSATSTRIGISSLLIVLLVSTILFFYDA